jgi:lipopolysaccharide transport system ATP-binding protein
MSAAIRVENLGKRYRLGQTHAGSVREAISRGWDRLLGRRRVAPVAPPQNGREVDPDGSFWALKDVSFEVEPGEVVGIIGRNGSGKSTLLKILSQITAPTEGRVELNGRVASLLEVGTGFHPELSGRENVFLNGAILGMTRAEVRRKFDEIVQFSEVEQFIDTPVKRYSSGMYVRLAFAVAAYLESEILIVDEVLAVGDTEFQQKCLRQMRDLGTAGRTVLFVSHNLTAVAKLTTESVLLSKGEFISHGASPDVIQRYLQTSTTLQCEWMRPDSASPQSGLTFTSIRCCDVSGIPRTQCDADSPFEIEICFTVRQPLSSQIAFRLNSSTDSTTIFTTALSDATRDHVTRFQPGRYRARCHVDPHLLIPGRYHLLVAANSPSGAGYDLVEHVLDFEITAIGSLTALEGRLGVIAPLMKWDLAAAD